MGGQGRDAADQLGLHSPGNIPLVDLVDADHLLFGRMVGARHDAALDGGVPVFTVTTPEVSIFFILK